MGSATNGEKPREHWGSRIGLIMAMAGNAVGLGNFLRFPTQAAANGGGAFMIPYFIAFFLLGIPLMWIEWGIGRYGGTLGHGTMPGVFHKIVSKQKWFKYVGVLAVVLPLFVVIYYNYIESWTMAYSYFSLTGRYTQELKGKTLGEKRVEMGRFLAEFQGRATKVKVLPETGRNEMTLISQMLEPSEVPASFAYDPDKHGKWNPFDAKADQQKKPFKEVALQGKYFSSNATAYIFFLVTFGINIFFLYRGLSGGIEQLGKIGMPILFGFAIILALRVLTIGRPEDSAWSIADGFNFLWTPRFGDLTSASVWLAAAGQIFFTLSLGQGAIQAYASYLSDKDDVVLSGLATASTNEFAEVILGGSIAIPAAVAFFGPETTAAIAKGGAFDLGFQALPMIFTKIDMGWFFGFIWFALLFIAGITSSVALMTPAIAYLKDEMKYSHGKAVLLIGALCFICTHGCIFGLEHGVIDEIDYWAGTFGLVLFAMIETIVFLWIFGGENAWKEMHKGADISIPGIFYYIMKYVTPVYIGAILIVWGIQDGWTTLIMKNVMVADRPYVWAARMAMLLITGLFMYLIWRRFRKEDGDSLVTPGVMWGFPALVLIVSDPGLFAIETNALLLLVSSWTIVLGLMGYSAYTMLMVPAAVHDDFPDDKDESAE